MTADTHIDFPSATATLRLTHTITIEGLFSSKLTLSRSSLKDMPIRCVFSVLQIANLDQQLQEGFFFSWF